MTDNEFEQLYQRYAPMILRRCRVLLRDEEGALDAMQDVFAKIWGKSMPSLVAPSSFLYTVATHHCLDIIRSAASRYAGGQELLLEIAAAHDVESLVHARGLLQKIFHRHKPSTRVMAALHYVDGLTLEEVAQRMGLSVSGIRKRLAALKASSEALASRLEREEKAMDTVLSGKLDGKP